MNYIIPKSVRVAGCEYTVEFVESLPNQGSLGMTDFVEQKILLAERVNGQEITEENIELTFVHELLHAIWDKYMPMEEDTTEQERVVRALSTGLYQVIKDLNIKDITRSNDPEIK